MAHAHKKSQHTQNANNQDAKENTQLKFKAEAPCFSEETKALGRTVGSVFENQCLHLALVFLAIQNNREKAGDAPLCF